MSYFLRCGRGQAKCLNDCILSFIICTCLVRLSWKFDLITYKLEENGSLSLTTVLVHAIAPPTEK